MSLGLLATSAFCTFLLLLLTSRQTAVNRIAKHVPSLLKRLPFRVGGDASYYPAFWAEKIEEDPVFNPAEITLYVSQATGGEQGDKLGDLALSLMARYVEDDTHGIVEELKRTVAPNRYTLYGHHERLASACRILSQIRQDDCELVREWAIDLLGRVGNKRDVGLIARSAIRETRASNRSEALAALGKIVKYRPEIADEETVALIQVVLAKTRDEEDERCQEARNFVADAVSDWKLLSATRYSSRLF